MKQCVFLIILALALVFAFAGCDTPADFIPDPNAPADFAFSIDFGIYGKSNIDTYKNTFTKDLVEDGRKTIDFVIPADKMQEIYEAFVEYNIFGLPADINAAANISDPELAMAWTPCSEYSLTYTFNGEKRTVVCNDGGPWDAENGPSAERNRLVDFVRFIVEYIYSSNEYQNMPPTKGGYE